VRVLLERGAGGGLVDAAELKRSLYKMEGRSLNTERLFIQVYKNFSSIFTGICTEHFHVESKR
jgi:hypothetical protein